MQIATTGLVLRRVKVGEADQILTLLTPDLGIVSASARGSLRLKNKLFSACGLFCYSEFTLTAGRSTYFVESAQIRRGFHDLGQSVEGAALAAYMAELAVQLAPAPPDADEFLRLLLNCLYMTAGQRRPLRQIKAIFELRTMALGGYMPNLLACDGCGRYEGGAFLLDTREGRLLCADCARKANLPPNLDAGALHALRHICLADSGKLFNFTLKVASLNALSRTSEGYLLAHIEHVPKSLAFLKEELENSDADSIQNHTGI